MGLFNENVQLRKNIVFNVANYKGRTVFLNISKFEFGWKYREEFEASWNKESN